MCVCAHVIGGSWTYGWGDHHPIAHTHTYEACDPLVIITPIFYNKMQVHTLSVFVVFCKPFIYSPNKDLED